MWAVFWLTASFVPFFQWPGANSIQSAWISWAVFSSLAGIVSCVTPALRDRTVPGLPALLFVFILSQMILHHRLITWVDWTREWGVIASFSASLCLSLLILWGTQAIITHSPDFSKYVPSWLFMILAMNLCYVAIQSRGGWTVWRDAGSKGGLFGSASSLGCVSTIAFPILWSFNRLSALPALFGIALSKSSSCVFAFASALLFMEPKKRLWKFLIVIPILISVLYFMEKPSWESEYGFIKSAQIRVETWRVNEKAITLNPFGIGFGPMAYRKAISSVSGIGEKSVLPHPGSDFMGLFLRLGVFSIPVIFLYSVKGLSALKRVPLDASLLSVFILACIQTSISKPQVGFFAWVLWMVWLIERGKYAERKIEESC